jgi:ribonuclease HI
MKMSVLIVLLNTLMGERKTPSHQIRLPHFAGIFEAEVCAINYALSSIRQNHSPDFSVFSDSQSVLKAISPSLKTIPIIEKIQKKKFNLLRQSINAQFHWVPGHRNIHSNELADKAARAAISNPTDSLSKFHGATAILC